MFRKLLGRPKSGQDNSSLNGRKLSSESTGRHFYTFYRFSHRAKTPRGAKPCRLLKIGTFFADLLWLSVLHLRTYKVV